MLRMSLVSAWKCRLVLLTSLCAATGSVAHAAAPVWIKVETPEFVAYTDASAKDLIDSALEYSAFHAAFQDLFAAPGHTLPPSTLLLFRRSRDFEAHTPKSELRNTTLVNYSVDVDGTALLALAVSGDRTDALARTFEFETIWALRRMGYFLPVWLSQGAGEVLATVRISKGKCLVGLTASDHEDRFYASGSAIPWPRFFEIGEGSPEYAGKQATGTFHSQAWALMHWILLKDGDSRQRFQSLAASLKNRAAMEAVQEVMAESPDHFRSAIERHLRDFHGPRTVPFDDVKVRARLVVTPASEAEVLAQTSNLLAAAGRIPECNAQLERARQLAPERADVKEAWARRALRENRPEDATQLYREAIAAGSKNFAAYLNSAAARLDSSAIGSTDHMGSGGPETVLALAEVRRALELNPGNNNCYRLLGRTFWVLPEVTEAYVEELSRGVTAGEAGARIRFYRGMLYSRLGKSNESFADFEQVISDPDVPPSDCKRAQERLAYERYAIDLKAINDFARQKQYDEARAVLRRAIDRGLDPTSSERYDALAGWLEQDAAWSNLMMLADAARWPALGEAAHKFASDFPKSRQVAAARRLENEAHRMEQQSAK